MIGWSALHFPRKAVEYSRRLLAFWLKSSFVTFSLLFSFHVQKGIPGEGRYIQTSKSPPDLSNSTSSVGRLPGHFSWCWIPSGKGVEQSSTFFVTFFFLFQTHTHTPSLREHPRQWQSLLRGVILTVILIYPSPRFPFCLSTGWMDGFRCM